MKKNITHTLLLSIAFLVATAINIKAQNKITLAKTSSKRLYLHINAAIDDQAKVWIDLNNNGTQDAGEKVTSFYNKTEYTLATDNQVATIYGNVTELKCDWNSITFLDVSKNTKLTKLNCSWNRHLTVLKVEGANALTELKCDHNSLTTLDVSKNTQLTYLSCTFNDLTKLKVSGARALTKLECDYNDLTSLDVSKKI